MDALFFINLPKNETLDTNTKLHWYKKNTQTNISSSGYNTLEKINKFAENSQCIGVIAGEMIYHCETELAIKNRKQREQALAYNLEEQLSEEVDQLHIAYQKKNNKCLDIHIINKKQLIDLLSIFEKFELPLQQLISNTQLLTLFPQEWVIFQDDNMVLLKAQTKSYALEAENLPLIFDMISTEIPPKTITVYGQATISINQPTIELLKHSSKIPLFNQLCQHYDPQKIINLLQGDFQIKTKKTWRTIQYLGASALLIMCSLTGYQSYQNTTLRHQETQLEQQMVTLYKNSFPKAKRIINPLSQMRSGLEKLKNNQANQGEFFPLLASLSRTMTQYKNIDLSTLQFNKHILLIDFSTPSLEQLERFKNDLLKQNINVEMASASKVDNRVLAQLKITGAR